MGKGRTRDPHRLKLLKQGKDVARVGPKLASPLAPSMPGCPLPLDDVGQAEWDRFGPILVAEGRLNELTASSFALYCDAWSRYIAAALDLRRNGSEVESSSGAIKSSPAVAVLRDAASDLRAYGAEFGLTPASRSRIGLAERVITLNPLDAFNAEEAV